MMSSTYSYGVVYPAFTPINETASGTFNTYFTNMYVPSGCSGGQVIRGFTDSGVLLCIVPPAAPPTPCTHGGTGNTCFGANALDSSTAPANNNTAIGYDSLTANTVGDDNTALGYQSLLVNTTGIQNTAIGSIA